MDKVVTFDLPTVAFVAGTVVPLVVGLLTKLNASSTVKAWANVVLSVVAGVCVAITTNNGSLTVAEIITAAAIAYVTSSTTYNHFWTKTGVAQAVQTKTANFGIGGSGNDLAEAA